MTTVISFYTNDWLYPRYALSLRADCMRLKLANCIEPKKTTTSYLKNCCMKPAFILEKLLQFKSPVLWVDCDATIRKQPIFFSGLTADIAAKKMPAHRERTWHVGTLWVNYTPAAIAFMEKWIANTGHISDESALNETWKKHSEEISIVDMPSSYFVIEPKNKNIPLDTVIMHRISDWPTKKREMPIAAARVKRGEF